MYQNIILPNSTMYDILRYVQRFPSFRGVKMRDELPSKPWKVECGVLNLNTHVQKGSNWIAWYKDNKDRYYCDSFGEPPSFEILQRLKTNRELEYDLSAIKRNAVTVHRDLSNECGPFCLFVLKHVGNGIGNGNESDEETLNSKSEWTYVKLPRVSIT